MIALRVKQNSKTNSKTIGKDSRIINYISYEERQGSKLFVWKTNNTVMRIDLPTVLKNLKTKQQFLDYLQAQIQNGSFFFIKRIDGSISGFTLSSFLQPQKNKVIA